MSTVQPDNSPKGVVPSDTTPVNPVSVKDEDKTVEVSKKTFAELTETSKDSSTISLDNSSTSKTNAADATNEGDKKVAKQLALKNIEKRYNNRTNGLYNTIQKINDEALAKNKGFLTDKDRKYLDHLHTLIEIETKQFIIDSAPYR